MFTATCESFVEIGRTACAPVVQHWVLQLVESLNFQNHREHVYNNLRKFHCNWINGMCSLYETNKETNLNIVAQRRYLV